MVNKTSCFSICFYHQLRMFIESYITQKPIHQFFVQLILKALLLPNSTEY